MNNLLTCALVIVFGLSLFACAPTEQEESGTRTVRLLVLEDFALTNTQWGVLLPVRLRGDVFLFLLDTGTTINIFDNSFRPLLGPVVDRKEISLPDEENPRSAEMYNHPDAYLGNLSLRTAGPVTCIDFGPFRRKSGLKVAGIIGMEFLKHYIVNVDFDAGMIEFCHQVDASNCLMPKPPFPEGHHAASPELTIALPTGPEQFMLDTGDNSAGAISPQIFDKLVDGGCIETHAHRSFTDVDGEQQLITGRLDEFEFQGIEFTNLVFSRSAPSRIGFQVLSAYNIYFDFPNGCANFSRRKKPQPQLVPQ